MSLPHRVSGVWLQEVLHHSINWLELPSFFPHPGAFPVGPEGFPRIAQDGQHHKSGVFQVSRDFEVNDGIGLVETDIRGLSK